MSISLPHTSHMSRLPWLVLLLIFTAGCGDQPQADSPLAEKYRAYLASYEPFQAGIQEILDAVYVNGPVTLERADQLIESAAAAAERRTAAPKGFDAGLDDLESMVPEIIATLRSAFNATKNHVYAKDIVNRTQTGENIRNEELKEAVTRAFPDGVPSYEDATPDDKVKVLETMIDVKWEHARVASNACNKFLNRMKELRAGPGTASH